MPLTNNLEEYRLEEFIAALQSIGSAEAEPVWIAERIRPLAEHLAVSPDLQARIKKEPDPDQGFGFQLLHEEPDHSLVVALLCWLPGRSTPPHTIMVRGVWWWALRAKRSTRSGSEQMTACSRSMRSFGKSGEKKFLVGESLVLMPDTIHSIQNVSEEISVSLHVYGYHINHTERSQFDPEQHSVQPWKIREIE